MELAQIVKSVMKKQVGVYAHSDILQCLVGKLEAMNMMKTLGFGLWSIESLNAKSFINTCAIMLTMEIPMVVSLERIYAVGN